MNEAAPRAEPIDPALQVAGLLKRLKHAPCLTLRRTGIADTARREVAGAGVQPFGQCPWHLPADLLIHASRHPHHLVSARYHIQTLVRNDRPAPKSPPSPEIR